MLSNHKLLRSASRDVAEISRYIARDNPDAARKLKAAIFNACEKIAENPYMGQVREDLSNKNVRFWPAHPNYMIIYRADTSPVHILRIYNTARDLGQLLH